MYQFTEDCYIGIPELDQEHLNLFKMVNEAMDSIKQPSIDKVAQAKQLLNGLTDYTLTHFAHEEAYMEQIKDPELPRQKKEHAAFIAKIETYSLENCTSKNAEQIMEELLSFLVRWLYRHILGSDIMIGKLSSHQKDEQKNYDDPLAFSSKFYTGITFIDEEHKKLFEIIRKAHDLIKEQFLHDKYDKIMEILDNLKQYTEIHFQNEEVYMEQIQYAGLDIQRRAHSAFVDRLVEVTYTDLDKIDENQEEYLYDLVDFLVVWLSNHILKLDKLIPPKP